MEYTVYRIPDEGGVEVKKPVGSIYGVQGEEQAGDNINKGQKGTSMQVRTILGLFRANMSDASTGGNMDGGRVPLSR